MGMAFLGCMADQQFTCGLDGHMIGPALTDWDDLVTGDLKRISRQFTGVETRKFGDLWGVRFTKATPWALVGHPLWDGFSPVGVLSDAINSAGDDELVVVDSFNLARRPVTIRKALMDSA
jgi:hypothetical protein